MNILEQEDMVKGLPDQVLIQQAQMPTGEIPQFLVVSELDRRQRMRKEFAERVPEETVAERVISGGIAAMNPNPDPLMTAAMGAQPPLPPPSPPMAGQPPQDPMMPPQDPMIMAAGGGMMPYPMYGGRSTTDVLRDAVSRGMSQKNIVELLASAQNILRPAEYASFLSEAQNLGLDISEFAAPPSGYSEDSTITSPYIPYGSEFDDTNSINGQKSVVEPVLIPGLDNSIMQQYLGSNNNIANLLGSTTQDYIEAVEMNRRQKLLDMAASNAIKEDSGKLDPKDQTKELVEMVTAPSTKDRKQVEIEKILAEASQITPEDRENFLLESGVDPAKDQTPSFMENMFGTYDPVIAARGRGEDVFMRNLEEDQISEKLGIDKSRYIPLITDVGSRAIPFTENFLPRRALLQLASGDIEDYIDRGLGAFSSTVSDVAKKGRDISELARQNFYGADIKEPAGRFADLIQRSAGAYGDTSIDGEKLGLEAELAQRRKDQKGDAKIEEAGAVDTDLSQVAANQVAANQVGAIDQREVVDTKKPIEEVNQTDVSGKDTLRRSVELAGTGEDKANTDLIQSLFGRSYEPTDKGALALVNLGAGIAKGDIGGGLQSAAKAIGDEEDRRRKALLSAAQAKYYESALARSNKDNVFDMYKQARLALKEMSVSDKATLLSDITGRPVGLKEVDALEGTLLDHLATQYAQQSLLPASVLAGLPRTDGEPSQRIPRDLTNEEIVMFSRKLGT